MRASIFAKLNSCISLPALFIAGMAGVPVAAIAQSTAAKSAGQINSGASVDATSGLERAAADDTGEIVVTGSRIPRAGFDTLEPATTISAELVESRGQTNVVDSLISTPSFGLGQTPQGAQGSFNAGQSFADRFGLGSARTLTLVNGRRFVSTNAPSIQGTLVGTAAPAGLQVDLNIIPALLIDRIENLSIGGAPAYGSDAIAGVVNIILKTKFKGVTASALSGITERGDNLRINLSALAGTSFADGRGNIMIAGTYDRSDGVLGTARKRITDSLSFQTNPLATSGLATIPGRTPATDGRVNTSIPFNTGNTDGIPNSVLIRNGLIGVMTAGGVAYAPTGYTGANGKLIGFGAGGATLLQFDSNGNLVPFDAGTPFATLGSGGDGFPLYSTTQILSGVERFTGNLNASFKLTPDAEVFVEGLYFRGIGRELVDQATYLSQLVNNRTGVQGPLLVSVNDPRLTPQARSTLVGLGVSTFQVSKTLSDFIDGSSKSLNEVYRAVGGIRGNFGLFGRDFSYEASANYGRTEGSFFRTQLIQQRFVNALNVKRDATGNIVCDAAPAFNVAPGAFSPIADPACVPLNLFGTGQYSAAARAYVTTPTVSRSLLQQTVLSANIASSSLIDLWSGPVGFSIGIETRHEQGRFTPDPVELAGQTQNAPILAAEGSFRTKEIFGELEVPLVSEHNNVPLVHSLSVEARGRYVDNSVNGGFTTYTFGGRYQPIQDVTFRGNFTRSLRAPAIVELFMPQAVGVATFPDPCDTRNITAGPAPAIRAANCAAFFSKYNINPATFVSAAVGVGQANLSGGNLNLKNESSDAYTFGLVLRPSFLPKLTAAVDWNRIKITGPIAQLSAADIASGCYDNPSFDASNPAAGNYFCTLFTRQADGQLVNDRTNPGVRSTFVNGSFINFKGLTANINYRDIELDSLGLKDTRLTLDGTFFYLDELCRSTNAVTTTCVQGTTTNPRYTGQVSATLTSGPFSVFGEVNYQSSTEYDLLFTNETRDILKLDSLTTANAAIAYTVKDDWAFRFTVTNLFDTDPPYPLTTGDLLGRRFTIRFTKSFR
jgi:outer membrane receptor protein involved in Fe transport